ncbi:uncharacterized protein LOC126575312 [Anopheles aquasalis]|uniref:uncharacterized protein LOC126575312 n=1 Tax=Anopheles aquasalis TaxID=42839 RepID=UPI00215B6472|nr:uncharacterized protein LOC126575312 [Anopheles aquasalis]
MGNKRRKWQNGFAVIGEFEIKSEPKMPTKSEQSSSGSGDKKVQSPSYAELEAKLSKMQIQQDAMAKQLKDYAALPIVQNSVEYQQLKSLASYIPLFKYCKHQETFDEWYFKYDLIFKKDTTSLNDRAKVQLLLTRLGESEHQTFVKSIEPKQVADLTFCEMIGKHMSLFAKTKSRTTRRLQFLQIQQKENEDSFSYSQRIDKAACAAEMDAIDEETMKCLAFISGLQSANQADLRKRLIEKMDKSITSLTLKDLKEMKVVSKVLEKKPKRPPHGAPWEAVHVGYLKALGQCFVVVLDEYSQWPEIIPAADFSAQSCIDCIDDVFVEHGLPQTIVTNDSNQFFSGRFQSYCYENGINHWNYSDYQDFYYQFIDYFKAFVSVNSIASDYDNASYMVKCFLSHFRDMPLGTAPGGPTPAELMFGYRIYCKYSNCFEIPCGYY